MSSSSRKEVQELVRELKRRGCTVTMARNGHWKVEMDGHQSFFMPGSPSDVRAVQYQKAKIRKILGIQL